MLEDACRPTMQMLLMPVAILILPPCGDVKPALAHSLIPVEAQAALIEAAGLRTNRLIAGIDDHVEREFRRLARIAVIAITYMILHHGQGQA